MNKPNLLFVFADQMRVCDWREGRLHAPNLEHLAREGADLPNCFANLPVCTPSRASLLTGLFPFRNRVPGNDLPLPAEVPSIGHFLREAGYRTGYIGKWHLDGVPRSQYTPPGPRRHGFEFWAAYNCSHAYFASKYFRDTPELIERPGYEPEIQTDLALEFLQSDDERPFALFLSWGPPHDPYDQVPDEFRALYPDEVELRGNAQPDCDNPLAGRLNCRETLPRYYAAISALDAQLGRLLEFLHAQGLTENTLVIFTSDHGDMLWSHGYMKKQLPFEESIGIPFLARWPGHIPAGSRPSALFSVVDFTPTLLGLLGVHTGASFDVANCAAALRGESCAEPDAVLLMEPVMMDEALHQEKTPWRGLRTRLHTYARREDGTPWLLFDNETDPLQLDNLIGRPEVTAIQRELDERLNIRLAQAGDKGLLWRDLVRNLDLVADWNAREAELHGQRGTARFLEA